MIPRPRLSIAALGLSALGFAAIMSHEGYVETAAPPVAGDVCTNGFGTTRNADGTPVQCGDRTTPVKAIQRSLADISQFEGALRRCVKVPLAQHEYDAYLGLAYNIGAANFCGSTLVARLNAGDYAAACREILRWDKFKGRPLPGLTRRRQAEYRGCLGEGA